MRPNNKIIPFESFQVLISTVSCHLQQVKKPSRIATTGSATPENQVGRVSIDIPPPPPWKQPDTSVEDLKIAPHVPTRSPAECAQHMEECPNGLAFLKRYATPKEVRKRRCGC
jgi:hypothetical protein